MNCLIGIVCGNRHGVLRRGTSFAVPDRFGKSVITNVVFRCRNEFAKRLLLIAAVRCKEPCDRGESSFDAVFDEVVSVGGFVVGDGDVRNLVGVRSVIRF